MVEVVKSTYKNSGEGEFKLTEDFGIKEKWVDAVNKYWKLELLGGINSENDLFEYAVRFTSKAKNHLNKNQYMTLFKTDISNPKKLQSNLEKLGRIGKIIQSYLVAVSSYLDEMIYEDDLKFERVEDMYMLKSEARPLPDDVRLEEIVKRIEEGIQKNHWRFPTKTSNEFSDDSYGAILDQKRNYDGSEYPVAILAYILQKFIGVRSPKLYSQILRELIVLGYIEGDITENEEGKERRKSRLITVAKSVEKQAYQFNYIRKEDELA